VKEEPRRHAGHKAQRRPRLSVGARSCRVGSKARRFEEAGVDSGDTWGTIMARPRWLSRRQQDKTRRSRLRRGKAIRPTMKSRKGGNRRSCRGAWTGVMVPVLSLRKPEGWCRRRRGVVGLSLKGNRDGVAFEPNVSVRAGARAIET
jgi:hypothetical protein